MRCREGEEVGRVLDEGEAIWKMDYKKGHTYVSIAEGDPWRR